MARWPWGVVVWPHSLSALKTRIVELSDPAAPTNNAGCHFIPNSKPATVSGIATISI